MLDIIFEDNDIIVCFKPAGTASQSEHSFEPDMVSLLMNHLAKSGCKDPYIGVVHRLDKPVSGILVYAKNKFSAAALSEQISPKSGSYTDGMEKYYKAAILSEKPLDIAISEDYTRMENFLIHDTKTNITKVCDSESKNSASNASSSSIPKKALLDYRILSCAPISDFPRLKLEAKDEAHLPKYLSIADIHLLTGRTHQIRVQFSSRDMYLVGDSRYSPYTYRRTPVALCAYKLVFKHPRTKKEMMFSIIPKFDFIKL